MFGKATSNASAAPSSPHDSATASLTDSLSGSPLLAKLDELRRQRAAERQAQIDERRAQWEVDRANWRGAAPDCLTCLDTGRDYVTEQDCACAAGTRRRDERDERELAERVELVRQQTAQVMSAVALPPDYADWTLANFPRRNRTLAHLRSWAHDWNGREGLILFGSYGVGKSSLMIGLMRELVTTYLTQHSGAIIRARFLRASELMTRLRAAMDSDDGAYDRLMTEAKQVRVFVLDDLGRENPKSDWVSETLFEIVDARYAHGLPIFATTNYSPEKLVARLGANAEAIMDRLNDRCTWVRVSGASMRKAQPRIVDRETDREMDA